MAAPEVIVLSDEVEERRRAAPRLEDIIIEPLEQEDISTHLSEGQEEGGGERDTDLVMTLKRAAKSARTDAEVEGRLVPDLDLASRARQLYLALLLRPERIVEHYGGPVADDEKRDRRLRRVTVEEILDGRAN